ncbi:Holliday junction branch migration protein RuvA [Rhodoluna sp.]|uniref:Holliday junction branch migration protein RuvA n=1 Tax=Rhodoluna sp. TaxID=1969481 RepID=UPI0025E3FA3B|nr:Holliday junction branch migration protein RuvA [Rhodoluna sp.]
MIASLTGKVQAKSQGSIVLSVAGVGYSVAVAKQLFDSLSVGDDLLLHTAFIVREDAFSLFGFAEVEQLALFDLLRSVSGVGPKTALAAIGTLSGADIANAVTNDDAKVFEQVSGIGTKTAKLIVVTLTGKLKSVGGGEVNQDLLVALQGLGWPERVADPVAKEVLKSAGNKPLADLIRESLAILGGKQ